MVRGVSELEGAYVADFFRFAFTAMWPALFQSKLYAL